MRFTVILTTTVAQRTPRQTAVVIDAESELAAIAAADRLAELDKSGRTVWSEIRPLTQLTQPELPS